jgi:DNA-binding CsgD family transcriptional regulator
MTSIRELVEKHMDWPSPQIAETYGISLQTVQSYKSRLKRLDHHKAVARRWFKRRYKEYAAENGVRPRHEVEWPSADIAYLKKWYAEKTASEIACDLGRSRNAVLNKANRMGLSKEPVLYRRDYAANTTSGGA